MRPHGGAFGSGLAPSGQQVDVTHQPVNSCSETQPAGRTDGCRSREKSAESRAAKPSPGWIAAPPGLGFDAPNPKRREGRQDESIGLTVERAFARARVLVSPHVAPPVPNSLVSEAHEPLCRKMRILKGESTNARVKSRLTLSARCCPSSCLRVTPGELTVSCLHLM